MTAGSDWQWMKPTSGLYHEGKSLLVYIWWSGKAFWTAVLYPVGDTGSESGKLEGTDVEFYKVSSPPQGIMVTGKGSLYGYRKH